MSQGYWHTLWVAYAAQQLLGGPKQGDHVLFQASMNYTVSSGLTKAIYWISVPKKQIKMKWFCGSILLLTLNVHFQNWKFFLIGWYFLQYVKILHYIVTWNKQIIKFCELTHTYDHDRKMFIKIIYLFLPILRFLNNFYK